MQGLCEPIALTTIASGLRARHPPKPLMVEKIQTLLTLLGIISVLTVVAERVKFPFPILLVIAGLQIALFPRLPEFRYRRIVQELQGVAPKPGWLARSMFRQSRAGRREDF